MSISAIVRRLLQALVVLLATYTLAFFLLSALPSDGVLARYASPDLALSLEELTAIRDSYGADEPLWRQYFSSLAGFLSGDFGYSVRTGASVTSMIAQALPGTLVLAAVAFVLAVVLAALIAAAAWFVKGAGALPSLMVSVPSFWIGIIIIQVVSFQLGWIPVIEPTSAQALVLPALTLSIPIAAPLAQVLVRALEQARGEPFVRVVRARGASQWWVLARHVARIAALPAVTMAGLLFGELVGGAVVTEAVFARQGLGQLTVDAVANRDTPVLLAVVLITATTYVLINLIVDVAYPLLDARLRRKVH
ncbi:ABC transporter permease [Corynebacterium uberis]|uniref:ABC transporter permease n=1 Tax=Corynebacterium TaxID=1716 RepID=UPI001D0A5C91|nr:ABC transporter permease [Corynebacterium uberis]MCZ9310014.1 ABC transporter permease [Corynebacterium sp. c6VSa_13]UDL73764.1 ABC transporter permease [Corynebacterium uberis]UDL75353.1 ABC transporter permease [Corynebacterium uberis]UDL77564.1 ABC transporter permease [Corynebacterium uberis]UDL79851.1 ABC transporter permease [Corynebacterium uberis]